MSIATLLPAIYASTVGLKMAGSIVFDGVEARLTLDLPTFNNPNRQKFTIAFWFRALTTTVPRRDLLFSTFPTSNNLTIALESAPNSFGYNDITVHFEFQDNVVEYGEWTHANIRVDTTQPVEADRVIIELDGVPLPDPNNTFIYPLNALAAMFEDNAEIRIGSARVSTTRFNGKLADFIVIEGQALPAAETNYDPSTGGWKDFRGSVGANGYRINPQDATELGLDQSGNGFSFTPTGVTFDTIDRPLPFDVPQASLPVGPIIVTEGDQARVDVTLNKPVLAGETVAVDFTVAAAAVNGATPVTDFDVQGAIFEAAQDAFVGTLAFNPGESSATILIDTGQDAVSEGTEQIAVSLTGTGGNVVLGLTSTTTVSIEDDDLGITFHDFQVINVSATSVSITVDSGPAGAGRYLVFAIHNEDSVYSNVQVDGIPLEAIVPQQIVAFASVGFFGIQSDTLGGLVTVTYTRADLENEAGVGCWSIRNLTETVPFDTGVGTASGEDSTVSCTVDIGAGGVVIAARASNSGELGSFTAGIVTTNYNDQSGVDTGNRLAGGHSDGLAAETGRIISYTLAGSNDPQVIAAVSFSNQPRPVPNQVFRGSNNAFTATQNPSISINCGPAAPRKFIIIAIHDEGSAISNVQIGGVAAVQRVAPVVQGNRSVSIFTVLSDTLGGEVAVTYQLAAASELHAVGCWTATNLTPTIAQFTGSGASADSDTVSCTINTNDGGVLVAARTSGDQFVDLGSFTSGVDVEDYDDLISPFGASGLGFTGGSASNLPEEIGRLISLQSGSVEANNVIAAYSFANVVPGRDIPPGATILELASLADAPPKPATK